MKHLLILFLALLSSYSPILASELDAYKKPWHILGFFDGENEELEKICEYNINQLEDIDQAYARIVAVFDRTYKKSRDSSVRIYDITQDSNRNQIISNSISIGERDMGLPDVLDEFLSKYLGDRNILIIKAHGYGIVSPPALRIGYNSPQDPLVISQVLRERLSRPLEVMIFDSCNMATIEVAYEFKDQVFVMVASQDLMYYSIDLVEKNAYSSRPGIDYINLVLNLRPRSDPITIGKNVVTGFMDIVSKKDALYNKATISALDLGQLDITVFKSIAEHLLKGLNDPEDRAHYMKALETTLEKASCFKPIGRNSILTHYDIQDFLFILEKNLGFSFDRPPSCVIQSYSNNYVRRSSGLSILFFKDLSGVSSIRKKDLMDKYSRSKFAKDTGWDLLIKRYHELAGTL
ncbi:MAG: hypothetical protein D3926_08385 [Desulfobacteraceae bacterium]|nr:MAG: hypothetical protein D3926_08385 [Desulfobacteraceae bacterium]